MGSKGIVYVIAAPSGAGKTTLVRGLVRKVENIEISVSHTTRPQRPGETHGVDYFFVETANFEQMIEQSCFLEYAKVFDKYYGTTREWVDNKLKAGIDVILEIDWQGAQQVRQLYPEHVSIFILPPSLQALEQRLLTRAQDDKVVIQQRMAAAKKEISHFNEFDYLIINDDVEHALEDLTSIVHAQRLRLLYQQRKHAAMLSNFS